MKRGEDTTRQEIPQLLHWLNSLLRALDMEELANSVIVLVNRIHPSPGALFSSQQVARVGVGVGGRRFRRS